MTARLTRAKNTGTPGARGVEYRPHKVTGTPPSRGVEVIMSVTSVRNAARCALLLLLAPLAAEFASSPRSAGADAQPAAAAAGIPYELQQSLESEVQKKVAALLEEKNQDGVP